MSETTSTIPTTIDETLDDDLFNHTKIAHEALKNYKFINGYYKEELSRTNNQKKIETIKESMRLAEEEYTKLQEKFQKSGIVIGDISDTNDTNTNQVEVVNETDVVNETEAVNETEVVNET